MSRPLIVSNDTIWNAGTSTTGFGGGAGASLVSRTLPSALGGGTQSCVTLTGSSPNSTMFATTPAPGDTSTKNGISFWLYADLSALSDKSAGIGSGCNVKFQTASAVDQFQADITVRHGWNHIRLSRNDFSVLSGSPTWSSTWVDIQIRLSGVAGVTHSISIINLAWIGAAVSKVCFVADDGYSENIAFAALLNTYGWKLTTPIISSLVGTAGKMTLSELQTLHDAGHAIVNHTNTHGSQPFMLSYTVAQAESEIRACRDYQIANGWTRNNEHNVYVAPYGECTDNILQACRNVGMTTYRGLFGDNFTTPSTPGWSPSGGVDDWPIPCESIISTTTLADMKLKASRAIIAGRPLIILIHKMVASPSVALEVSTANVTALVSYIYSLSALCDIVTLPEMIQSMQNPAM